MFEWVPCTPSDIYRHLAHIMLQQLRTSEGKWDRLWRCGGVWGGVLKDFLLQPPCWGTDSRGEELTRSGCPFTGIPSTSPATEGCARCLAVPSPSPMRCSSLKPKGIFYLRNIVIFLITFQFIETHKYICVPPWVCALPFVSLLSYPQTSVLPLYPYLR